MPKVRKGAFERWVKRASIATEDYRAGVQEPRRAWKEATLAAKEAWRQGVQQAISQGRWERQVSATRNEDWEQKAATLGADRYAPGVQAAQEVYAARVSPYLQAIERLSLPPRGPKGDPRNLERVRLIAQTLHQMKTGGRSSTSGR